MTTTFTPNLKLRLSDDLTDDALYNLNRIDLLGSSFSVTSTGAVNVRSQEEINLLPNSPDLGGSGAGGTVNIGSPDQSLTDTNIWSDLTNFVGATSMSELRLPDDAVSPTYYSTLRASASLTESTTWTLPLTDGTALQVLQTDGAGQLNWTSVLTDTLPENNVRVGNASSLSIDTDTASSGDILADSVTGLTIKDGAITDSAVNAAAGITRSKLADGAGGHVLINAVGGEMSSEAQLSITRGGTGAATAAAARTALGVVPGTDVQVWDTDLDDLAALSHTDDNVIISDSGSWTTITPANYAAKLGIAAYSATWTTSTTFVASHNLGTSDVMVEVYDIDTGKTLYPDDTDRTDSNTVTLTASTAPTGSGRRVLIKEIS